MTATTRKPTVNRKERRRQRLRSRTIAPKRLTPTELRMAELLAPERCVPRPRKRRDCVGGVRPCPFVSCRHHLHLDVDGERGSLKLNFPDLEVYELPETCSLDAADRGGMTLEEVGDVMNLTRERIRQVEERGLEQLKEGVEAAALAAHVKE